MLRKSGNRVLVVLWHVLFLVSNNSNKRNCNRYIGRAVKIFDCMVSNCCLVKFEQTVFLLFLCNLHDYMYLIHICQLTQQNTASPFSNFLTALLLQHVVILKVHDFVCFFWESQLFFATFARKTNWCVVKFSSVTLGEVKPNWMEDRVWNEAVLLIEKLSPCKYYCFLCNNWCLIEVIWPLATVIL